MQHVEWILALLWAQYAPALRYGLNCFRLLNQNIDCFCADAALELNIWPYEDALYAKIRKRYVELPCFECRVELSS